MYLHEARVWLHSTGIYFGVALMPEWWLSSSGTMALTYRNDGSFSSGILISMHINSAKMAKNPFLSALFVVLASPKYIQIISWK